MWSHRAIRDTFLKFFEGKGHKVLPSFPLIPENDPTLLFVAAGMVPFKPEFAGKVKPKYKRVATCQKCFRADDIDNVGHTIRHHTFFEMLGNFSFGDYFKEEAITWAWELLTEVYKLDKSRLWISVHPTDEEAYNIWRSLGVPEDRIIKLEDNFWGPAGKVGPCGPSTEILYDLGPEYGDCRPEDDCDRYLELWNIVFTTYFKDSEGNYLDLPQKNIDTGAGLERLAMVLQGTQSPFDTDLFKPLMDRIEEFVKVKDAPISYRRIVADHVRASIFLLGDGAYPSNEGRGYVLRRIIRRASLYAKLLGIDKPFMKNLIDPVIEVFRGVYNEIIDRRDYIEKTLENEEKLFRKTLDKGLSYLERKLEELKRSGVNVLPGEIAFYLYDTMGFPIELTKEIASSKGFEVDEEKFREELERQRERSRAAQEELTYKTASVPSKFTVKFVGYEKLRHETEVIGILRIKDGNLELPDELREGESGAIVLKETPFYGESGGQVGDQGYIRSEGGTFKVEDTQHNVEGFIVHIGKVESGTIKRGARVVAEVDEDRRRRIMGHHTATHLLHSALRKVLGPHVYQTGSLVAPDRLRFDFTHFAPLKEEEIKEIEDLVNRWILDDIPVVIEYKPLEQAKEEGAIALFGEKYSEIVRTVKTAKNGEVISYELCGGTHVSRTGQIGTFKITSERAVALGVRRVEAKVGLALLDHIRQTERTLHDLSKALKTSPNDLLVAVRELKEENEELKKELESLESKIASSVAEQLIRKHEGDEVFVEILDLDPSSLIKVHDYLKTRTSSTYLLGAKSKDKLTLLLYGPLSDKLAEVLREKGIKLGGRPGKLKRGGCDLSQVKVLEETINEFKSSLAKASDR